MFLQHETDNRQTSIVTAELGIPTAVINPIDYHRVEQMVSIGRSIAGLTDIK